MKMATVKAYMNAGLSIMISGQAGTGKTYVLKEAADSLGWKMKYYSAATLDAQADLLGIPVPNKDNTSLNYIRPLDIDEAEVVFFDEVNRTDDRTIAAIFEITQFRTINGNPLPNLKSVCIAINPAEEGYNVRELDLAFVDRFDVYLNSNPEINYGYFSKMFGAEVAKVAKSWWDDYFTSYSKSVKNSSNESQVYISPRRMEKMLTIHSAFKNVGALRDALPVGATADVRKLHAELMKAYTPVSVKKPAVPGSVDEIIGMSTTDKRRDEMADKVMKLINDPTVSDDDKRRLSQDIAMALRRNVGISRLKGFWLPFLNQLPTAVFQTMSVDWNDQKKRAIANALLYV